MTQAITVFNLTQPSTGGVKPQQSDPLGNGYVNLGPKITAVSQEVGTIAATGTLQATSLVTNPARVDASIVNNSGTNTMKVSFGASLAAPALAAAWPIAAGGTLTLSGLVGNYQGPVVIAGTTADTFGVIELT